MKLVISFLLVFFAGPVAFWVLARQDPDKRHFIRLWAAAIALVGTAFGLDQLGPPTAFNGLMVIMALWFAWIVVLALCVLAARLTALSATIERWAFIVGAMASTVPWFGFYAAQMMAQ